MGNTLKFIRGVKNFVEVTTVSMEEAINNIQKSLKKAGD